jgi:hypothetical protein
MRKPSSTLPRKQVITTIGAVISQQSIVPDWMRKLQSFYGDKAKVGAEYIDAAFGTYCVGMEVVHELVFRNVYTGEKHLVHPADEGQSLEHLRKLASVLVSVVEKQKGGEWYCSSIVHSNNGDFQVFPHPEDFAEKA